MTLCIVQGLWWHATPHVVRVYVHYKGNYSMPCSSSSDRVCCPRAMTTSHAWRRPNVCAIQGLWWHAMPYIVLPCMLLKGNDGIPCPISSDRICCPRVMMACHARHSPFVCVFQRQWWHSTSTIVQLYGGSSSITACHIWIRPIVCSF